MPRLTLPHIFVSIAVIVFLGILAVERYPDWFPSLTKSTSAETITGVVEWVRDGDTIEVDGTPVRFSSLNCDERGTPRGDRATDRMKRLVSGKTVNCYLTGRQSYDRMIGSCVMQNGRDIGAVMIKEGYCERFW